MKHIFTKSIALIVAGMMMSATAVAQISITGTTYTQNFNSIGGSEVTPTPYTEGGNSKTAVAQASTMPTGWKIEANTTVRTIGTYSAASSTTTYIGGASITAKDKNGTWNFGATGNDDRAVGGITSSVGGGAKTINVMAKLHNDASVTIPSLALSYDIEKYRNGSNAAGFTVQLYFSTDGETWLSAGDEFKTVFAKDANSDGTATPPIATETVAGTLDYPFMVGADLYLAWSISVSSGADCANSMALAIDEVSITPAAYAVSINDFSTISENFNSIGGASANPEPDAKKGVNEPSVLPTGWKIDRNLYAIKEVQTFAGSNKSTMYIGGQGLISTSYNGTWNFGGTGSDDRAIGGITSGNVDDTNDLRARCINVMTCLFNNTGKDIASFALQYDIEKYRNGNNSNGFAVQLYTSEDGVNWTSAGNDFKTEYDPDGNTDAFYPPASLTVNEKLQVALSANRCLYLAWNISVKNGTNCASAPALAIDNVSITPVLASNELFATYQKFGETLYEGDNEAILEATSHTLAVNYYIVTCGDSILLRATTTEDHTFTAGWQTQLRVWTNTYNNGCEVQTNAGNETKNCYTSICRRITPTAEDIKMHFFLNWPHNCASQTFAFNRASINNPIEDNTAPVIDPEDVTMAEIDGKLVFTFGDVTADEPYFYYVADKDHNLGGISLTNKVYITKPTVEDGTTYRFKCYAVDYNGNKSDYKEFSVVMSFNPELDLAYEKTCTAGYYNGGDIPANAVNGANNNHWGTWQISDYSKNWWQVDLNNAYNLSVIKVEFEHSNTFTIEGSTDNVQWTEIKRVNEAPAAGTLHEYSGLTAAARYLRLTALGNDMISIRHFKVYATGVAVADDTDPTVTVSCTAKTVNTATLQIIAADEDDEHNAGTITSIKITGDNGFAGQEVLGELDGDNKVTLSGLTDNKTYHFTVTVTDLAGNTASANVEVALPFNTNLNLCLAGTATDGFHEGDYVAANAIDGSSSSKWNSWGVNGSTHGYADNWMRVDLGAAYNLRNVTMSFDWHNGNRVSNYVIEGSLDDSNWYLIEHVTDQSATSASLTINAPAQYVRFRAITERSLGIYEFEVYASGFSTLVDAEPVITYAKVGTIEDESAEIEIDAADITTKPITKYMVSGLGGDAQEFTASEGKITLTSLSQSTHYTLDIQAKDGNGNLSAAKQVEFTTPGSVSGLYFFGSYYSWNKTNENARFTTTAEPNVLSVTISNMSAGTQTYKMYNAGADRCTAGDCSGNTDHQFELAEASNVTFYATDEDHFICTADEVYLRGSLVGEDKALVWNAAHTIATWEGALDLSGTKQFTVVKKNQVGADVREYDHDFFYEVQIFDGEYAYGKFTLDITKMTGTWGGVDVEFVDDGSNTALITANNNQYANVTLNRTIAADGTWYTICLPFDMSAEKVNEVFGEGTTIAELIDTEDKGSLIRLNFDFVNAMLAGKPYMIKVGQDFTAGSTISGVTIQDEAPIETGDIRIKFVGTYNKIKLEAENQRFVADDNMLYSPAEGGTWMGAFRCYFTIPDGSPASAPGKRAYIVFGPQGATGMDAVEQNAAPSKIMLNGVLYIIRDGKTYNAQGMVIGNR